MHLGLWLYYTGQAHVNKLYYYYYYIIIFIHDQRQLGTLCVKICLISSLWHLTNIYAIKYVACIDVCVGGWVGASVCVGGKGGGGVTEYVTACMCHMCHNDVRMCASVSEWN